MPYEIAVVLFSHSNSSCGVMRTCALTDEGDYTRISVIVFSNSSYNKLPPFVVEEMEGLGFTAQSSDCVDLPYFKRYRIDKKVSCW